MTGSSRYPHLLDPITIGDLTLRNRAVMGSMHTGLEDNFWDMPKLAAYFAARARGGVGLIVTGGYAPNKRGWLKPLASEMTTRLQAERHKQVTGAVHDEGGAIALQVLHAGRYAYHPFSVSASATKAPINPFKASALSTRGVDRTVSDFARAAGLARRAGYDAVEIMGSEGYLINQFLAARTNRRTDAWGGTAEKRMRFPVEIVRRTRETVGDGFPIIYRLSLLDLVEGGQTWDEVVTLAHLVEEAGATVVNTGIGWHEARVPTIITQVPRGAWTWTTQRLRGELSIPVCASNRINTPELADRLIADGTADLVSMARPLLADPEFVNKAAAEREDEIITCIACNQACLDHAFKNQKASCMLNPQAGRETELLLTPVVRPREVAVVGGGPAGLSAAVSFAERGDRVTLFEKGAELGGQFRLAMQIPGKEEFAEALRYFRRRLEILGVDVRLRTEATTDTLAGFDEVVIATGVEPRMPAIPGIEPSAGSGRRHPKVVSYADLLNGSVVAGNKVAVIGAGGIGVDVAHFLTHDPTETTADWLAHWGVGDPAQGSAQQAGGLSAPKPREPVREVTLVQRKTSLIGKGLGKTSGWAHRAVLKQAGVTQISGASYELVDDRGLHLTVDGERRVLEVDHVVVCAGQESVRSLYDELTALGRPVSIIGGADLAAELDAKRAIEQGVRLAAS